MAEQYIKFYASTGKIKEYVIIRFGGAFGPYSERKFMTSLVNDICVNNKKEIVNYGVEKFVQKCRDRVMKFAAVQTEQSKRLGMWADWGHDYYTMSDENNYAIWNFLKVCHQRGWIYKGNDSVPWCPPCETAISQHEMLTEDYKQVIHKAIYLELPITKNRKQKTENNEQ